MKNTYKGGMDQLKPVSEAATAHEAVGLWWAHQAIVPLVEFYEDSSTEPEITPELITVYENNIGGFATALATVSASGCVGEIRVDFDPDPILTEAGLLSDVPVNRSTFAYKSATWVINNVVMAQVGGSGAEQIWPPTAAKRSPDIAQ